VADRPPTAPRPSPVAGTRSTAAELKDRGVPVESPTDRFRAEVLRLLGGLRGRGLSREEALAALFPRTILPGASYEDVVASIISGAHLLFFGPSGAGKTSLAKDLWNLFPKGAWVVSGCPVLDHPLSIVDPAASGRFPPCPICQRRFAAENEVALFDPARVDPTKVPAEFVRLREGFGFARLQGSSEVFPDHLTGNINLRRLEEVGDPMSPLVLEPGKLLQANRGLLLVDEIGKLPLGTQNVLLQALQEGTVTPSKSRESFPAAFVAVCTSNLSDLDSINDPLSDRLTSLHIGFNANHRANRRIVDLGYTEAGGGYVPEILLDAGVRLLELWRLRASDDNPDVGEVGSNRTLIDAAQRTRAFAVLGERPWPGVEDLRVGVLHAMRGRIRARSGDSFLQNTKRITEFLERHFDEAVRRSALVYWCRYFRSVLRENRAEGEALVAEGRRLLPDAALREQFASSENFPRFRAFVSFVGGREHPVAPPTEAEAALAEFALLEKFSTFTCEEGTEDDVR
jgi:Mg-chelatase subunit ChlI